MINVRLPDHRQREDAFPHRRREQLVQVPDAGPGHQLPVEQSLHIRRIGANRPAIEVTGNRGGILVVEEPAGEGFSPGPRAGQAP